MVSGAQLSTHRGVESMLADRLIKSRLGNNQMLQRQVPLASITLLYAPHDTLSACFRRFSFWVVARV
jgi:hypothetical protein